MKQALSNTFYHEIKIIHDQIQSYTSRKKKIFATSSFQTQSIPLLHILSRLDSIQIVFIDTGYHFKETISFKEQIRKMFKLNIINVKAESASHNNIQQVPLYKTNPSVCCRINKVQPLSKILDQYDIWITGIRKDQTLSRSKLEQVEKGSSDITRFHPMIYWTPKMINDYITFYQLPRHPLDSKGYTSIGCYPCTTQIQDNDDYRSGRWANSKQDECGLHTTLLKSCK